MEEATFEVSKWMDHIQEEKDSDERFSLQKDTIISWFHTKNKSTSRDLICKAFIKDVLLAFPHTPYCTDFFRAYINGNFNSDTEFEKEAIFLTQYMKSKDLPIYKKLRTHVSLQIDMKKIEEMVPEMREIPYKTLVLKEEFVPLKFLTQPVELTYLKKPTMFCWGTRGITLDLLKNHFFLMSRDGSFSIADNDADLTERVSGRFPITLDSEGCSVSVSPLGSHVLVTDFIGSAIYLYETAFLLGLKNPKQSLKEEAMACYKTLGSPWKVVWVSDSEFCTVSWSGFIQMFTLGSVVSSRDVNVFEHPISAVDHVPGTNDLICGDDEANTFRLDLNDKVLLWKTNNHKARIREIAIAPGGKVFASGGRDKVIILQRAEDGQIVGNFHIFKGFKWYITTIKWSPCERFLVVVSGTNVTILRRNTFNNEFQEMSSLSDLLAKSKSELSNVSIIGDIEDSCLTCEVNWEKGYMIYGRGLGRVFKINII